jgi:hypothetical protein
MAIEIDLTVTDVADAYEIEKSMYSRALHSVNDLL